VLKIQQSFPLSSRGWKAAWQALESQNPDSALKCRAVLRERETRQRARAARTGRSAEVTDLDQRTLASMTNLALLGGYAAAPVAVGDRYDVRFLDQSLSVFAPHDWEPLTDIPYAELEDIEIGGPGLIRSGGGFVGGGFGAAGAFEGMAVAAVLNAMTTRTAVTTIVRVQARTCELFLLETRATPAQLRMQISRGLGAFRAARTTPAGAAESSPVMQLAKLAELLQSGLITREDFDQFKARLLE
jgi:hypothetical protein